MLNRTGAPNDEASPTGSAHASPHTAGVAHNTDILQQPRIAALLEGLRRHTHSRADDRANWEGLKAAGRPLPAMRTSNASWHTRETGERVLAYYLPSSHITRVTTWDNAEADRHNGHEFRRGRITADQA